MNLLSRFSRRVSRLWAGIGSFSAISAPFEVLVYPDKGLSLFTEAR